MTARSGPDLPVRRRSVSQLRQVGDRGQGPVGMAGGPATEGDENPPRAHYRIVVGCNGEWPGRTIPHEVFDRAPLFLFFCCLNQSSLDSISCHAFLRALTFLTS